MNHDPLRIRIPWKQIVFICFLYFSFFSLSYGLNRNIRFTHLTNDIGLLNNAIYSISQDYKGFFWIGTKGGLCKFDGKNIASYQHLIGDEDGIPHNQIRCVYEDRQKRLWVATMKGVCLYNRDMENFSIVEGEKMTNYTQFIHQGTDDKIYICGNNGVGVYNEEKKCFEPFSFSQPTQIGKTNSIASDIHDRLWFGTMANGLLCVDTKSGTQRRFRHNKENKNSLISDKILSLYNDSEGRIWIGTEDKGVCYFDENANSFVAPDHFPEVCVHCFSEDVDGNIWIGTENGLFIYSPEKKSFDCYKQNYGDIYSLNDNSIHTLYKDREGNMLVGTYFGGINIYPNSFRQFLYFDSGYTNNHLSGKAVRQIIGDKNRNLWIATEDGGLNFYDFRKGQFEHFRPETGKNSISYHNVHSVLLDSQDNLWVGTYLGGLNKFNFKSRKFSHYLKKDYPGLAIDNIFSLIEDSDGTIWIGTTSGISLLDPRKDEFSLFEVDIFKYVGIDNLMEDSDKNIWIATRTKGAFCYNKQTKELKNFISQHGEPGIIDNFINYLYEDSGKNIWFGLHEGGLCKYDKKTGRFSSYMKKDGLPSNTVYGIIEGNDGNLWISTDNGLSCFNLKGSYFTNYSVSEGLTNKQFNYNSVYKDVTGMLYFGTINGMIAFYPQTLQQSHTTAHVEFTDFKILGKSVKPEEPGSPLTKSIGEIEEIHLDHEQGKSFTFDFMVTTISHSFSTGFAIKLNTDKDWSYIGSQNHITFANLPPGEYLFMVKAAFNNKWEGNEPVKTMKIIISPPFWLSSIAFFLYGIALIALLYFLFKFIQRRQTEKNAILSERMEKEKIKEINILKLNFFTNISHELRTPLSLIISPLQSLLEKRQVNPEAESKIKRVLKSALKMNVLIDELMMFTKIETEQEKIRIKKGDMLGFIQEICNGFQVLAEEKNLEYSITCLSPHEDVWFAPVKVEKILYNLLSNAFKYTEAGSICVEFGIEKEAGEEVFHLSVSDTGVGIPENQQESIFENYYQVNDFVRGKKVGFGIGLALTRKLVLLHKGSIKVESKLGEGSCFSICLNVSKEAFSPEEISDKDADLQFMEDYKFIPVDSVAQYFTIEQADSKASKYTLLIAEDNPELLQFYQELFIEDYSVIITNNGDEASQIAQEKLPDIIISDVMMPGMNGYEFCEKIKSEVKTCHIPFILLTAKTGNEAQNEGYGYGADLFIEKPFHPVLLQKQIANLIATKENQKKMFLKNQIGVEEITNNDRDRQLIDSVREYILKNLQDENLSIEHIVREIGISRTLLYMKLKNITGLSATEFINNTRLKESLKILLAGGNVSEAAYAVGFSSPNYYSRCFKKHFGVSPAEYAGKI